MTGSMCLLARTRSRLRDRRHDLLVGRVAAAGGLGKDESTVRDDLESAAPGRNHLDVDAVESLPERGRQTDGSGPVVSSGAVFYGYAHGAPLSCLVSYRVAIGSSLTTSVRVVRRRVSACRVRHDGTSPPDFRQITWE